MTTSTLRDQTVKLFEKGCPVCGNEQSQLHCEMDSCRYVRCESCQLIYQTGMMHFSDMLSCYTGPPLKKIRRKILNRFRKIERQRDFDLRMNRARMIFHFSIQDFSGPERIYLDIGCNKGFNLYAAMEEGWEAYGNELVPEIIIPIQNSKPILKERIKQGGFSDLAKEYKDNRFDLVTCIDVIEHLPEVRKALVHMHRILKPGGTIVFQTPEATPENYAKKASWKALKPNEHLLLFNRSNFEKILTEVGFISISFHEPFEVADGNFVARCKKKGTESQKQGLDE